MKIRRRSRDGETKVVLFPALKGRAKIKRRSATRKKSELAVANFKFLLQYDGTDFHGWQMQSDLRTVQGELTQALSLIDGRPVTVQGSGRTDAGVHAEGQVANADILRSISPEKLRGAVNANVGADLRVMDAEIVSDDFHARFSAKGKTYVYRIINSQVLSPFWLRFAHQEARPLNLEAMQRCSEAFVGEHDWTAFSSAQTDAESRIRKVTLCKVQEVYESSARARIIEIKMNANGFLRYMVRSIAGTLMAVGRGEMNEQRVKQAIESGDRSLAGATAPASGLTLLSVDY
jgi:tRNA pseudouridine38-40 synthase